MKMMRVTQDFFEREMNSGSICKAFGKVQGSALSACMGSKVGQYRDKISRKSRQGIGVAQRKVTTHREADT